MTEEATGYAARLELDHPAELDRLTTLLRIIWIIPIGVVAGLLSTSSSVIIEPRSVGRKDPFSFTAYSRS